jgi:hypothetical protein
VVHLRSFLSAGVDSPVGSYGPVAQLGFCFVFRRVLGGCSLAGDVLRWVLDSACSEYYGFAQSRVLTCSEKRPISNPEIMGKPLGANDLCLGPKLQQDTCDCELPHSRLLVL